MKTFLQKIKQKIQSIDWEKFRVKRDEFLSKLAEVVIKLLAQQQERQKKKDEEMLRRMRNE